jgi:hypothetical protein
MDIANQEQLDPWYVTGLIEGEGSFTYNRSGKNWIMIFAVKLNPKNRPILGDLLTFFGVGKIYEVSGAKASAFYRVSKQEELEQIIDHFERFPLKGNKQDSYQVWKQMVELKAQSFRKPPNQTLEELSKQLSASSIRTRD